VKIKKVLRYILRQLDVRELFKYENYIKGFYNVEHYKEIKKKKKNV